MARGDRIDQHYQDKLTPEALQGSEKEVGESSSAYTDAGIDQAEAYVNDPVNASQEELKERETNPMNYESSGGVASSGGGIKGFFKKAGPTGGIIGLIIAALGGGTMLLSPGLAVVHIKEILTEDLNDQLAAMDIRTTHVFKAKFQDMSKGALCSGISKAKCKFRGMSDRQIKAFERAGIEVETDGEKNSVTRKTKVTSLTFTDSRGNKVVLDNPRNINRLLGDRTVRNSLRKAFNPKFAGFYDKISSNVIKKFAGSSKADKLKGTTAQELDESMDDSVEGKTTNLEAGKTSGETDEDKNINLDQDEQLGEQQGRLDEHDGGVKGVFSVAKGGVKGLGILGITDNLCTVKNTARAVAAGAKVIRAAQLARFALVFLTFADQVKAGEATPEQADYVGKKLTSVDMDKTVVNENSKLSEDSAEEVKNPYYGKSAFDSEGYKVAAYNDAPTLSARASQFAIGGGLIGSLSKFNSKVPGDKECGFVQNPFVRTGSLVLGILAGIGSGGGTIVASVAISSGIALALPILESYLKDILAGTAVSSKTHDVDVGNATFGGTAALQGEVAKARALKPLNKEEISKYRTLSQSIESEYIAMETEDAKAQPFDVMSQYSFLGSLVRKILPYSGKISSGNLAVSMSGVGSFMQMAFVGNLPVAKAVGDYNPERFEKCVDPGYEKLGIDADIFCNVRYGLSEEELSLDSDEVVDFMLDEDFIDEEGNPINEFEEWVAKCPNREAGWGEKLDENDNDGTLCLEGDGGRVDEDVLQYFRIYWLDDSVNNAMDYEGPEGQASAGEVNGVDLTIWKLTLPDTSEIGPDELQTFSQPPEYWKDSARGGVVFRANAGGPSTGGSDYSRSELRELTGGKDEGKGWTNSSGVHEMTITQTILAVPTDTKAVVAGQIHDDEDDVVRILLRDGVLSASFSLGKGKDKILELDPNYKVGTKFTVKITATGGKTSVTYSGTTTKTVTFDRAYDGAYFKAGVYTQSKKEGAGYGEVIIHGLSVTHT